MSDSAMSIVAGRDGIPKRTTLPPCRTIPNASSIASSAPDISKTTPMPMPSFCSANHAGTSSTSSTLTTASAPSVAREVDPERHVVGREQPARAERLRDGDREEPDRAAAEDRDRTPGEILRRRREDRVAERLLQAGDVAAAASRGRCARPPTPGSRRSRRSRRRDRRRGSASARTCAPSRCGSGSTRRR